MAPSPQRTPRRRAKASARGPAQKPCTLCREKVRWVDYKDVTLLRRYLSDRGKIRSRGVTGNCAQHQGEIASAIKTARQLVLLPYAQRTVTERRVAGGREQTPLPGARPMAGSAGGGR